MTVRRRRWGGGLRGNASWRGFGIVALATLTIGCERGPDPPWRSYETSTDAQFRDMYFLDAGRGWLVGGGFGIEGGILGETVDGGRTWRFRTGIVPNPRSRLFHLNAIHFWDDRRGVIAADGGRLLRTVDGGAHWHGQIGGAGRSLSDVFVLDGRLAWAVGESWVLQTLDAGETWQRVNGQGEASDDFRALSVHFLDADEGVLVGHHGAIRRSADGGVSWPPADVPETLGGARLASVTFADATHGWIVGENGMLLASDDAGHSWSQRKRLGTADLGAVAFVDRWNGWIVGYDSSSGVSTVWRTRDAGAQWDREASIEGEALRGLFFIDADRGFAFGGRERRHPQRLLRYAPSPPRP